MRDDHQLFLQDISSLLLSDQPAPYLVDLHPGIPSAELDAVSSLYELHFDEEAISDVVKTGLGIEVQLCRQFFGHAAEGVEQGYGFLNMDGVWIEKFRSPSMSSSGSPSVSPSATQGSVDGAETKAKTFLVITEFLDQHQATTIFNSGSITHGPHLAAVCTAGEYFTENILQECSRWSKHDVIFETVYENNVDWLDKEEKWSVYVKRQLAEEDARRAGR